MVQSFAVARSIAQLHTYISLCNNLKHKIGLNSMQPQHVWGPEVSFGPGGVQTHPPTIGGVNFEVQIFFRHFEPKIEENHNQDPSTPGHET